jgi:predicted  nucleic acid-binding Zn-ribbon protein
MARRILTAILIYFSAALLILSVAGIGLTWIYRVPVTHQAVSRMQAVDQELVQAQTAIRNARSEMERTLRIVDTAEKALTSLKSQTEEAKKLFDEFNQSINSNIIPGLQSTRSSIDQLRATLVRLRETLGKINNLPLVGIGIPGDQLLANLIDKVDQVNLQIKDLQDLAQRASTFTSDTSFVLGGDMTETKQHMNDLLNSLVEYDNKVTAWHEEAQRVIAALPGWINWTAIGLTIFLAWFAISQFGMFLHGLALQQGGDPLAVIRRRPAPELPEPVEPADRQSPRSSIDEST